jgi:hypothetical protein
MGKLLKGFGTGFRLVNYLSVTKQSKHIENLKLFGAECWNDWTLPQKHIAE